MAYRQTNNRSSQSSALFGVPSLLRRAGLATDTADATQKAKLLLTVIALLCCGLTLWLLFGSGGNTVQPTTENYYDPSTNTTDDVTGT